MRVSPGSILSLAKDSGDKEVGRSNSGHRRCYYGLYGRRVPGESEAFYQRSNAAGIVNYKEHSARSMPAHVTSP